MIQFINFSKKYNKNAPYAVKNISLTAEDKTITGLLGVNGSGKTTLIKAASLIHYATEGSVLISTKEGSLKEAFSNQNEILKNIGYVPEQLYFYENLTVKEHLFFTQNLYAKKITQKEKSNFDRIVSLCTLENVLEKKIAHLSKGFRQRLALASALIHNPKNLILDEPTNGLDPLQIIQFRKIIQEASKTCAVLISSHVMQELDALCSKIYIISNGIIPENSSGTKEELLKKWNVHSLEDLFLKVTQGGIKN